MAPPANTPGTVLSHGEFQVHLLQQLELLILIDTFKKFFSSADFIYIFDT